MAVIDDSPYHTNDHARGLGLVLVLVLVLNSLDAIFTLYWVRAGLATEANPLLSWLVNQHPIAFTLAKFALVLLGSILLWRLRHRALAVVGIVLVFLAYYGILLHHLRSSSHLILSLSGLP